MVTLKKKTMSEEMLPWWKSSSQSSPSSEEKKDSHKSRWEEVTRQFHHVGLVVRDKEDTLEGEDSSVGDAMDYWIKGNVVRFVRSHITSYESIATSDQISRWGMQRGLGVSPTKKTGKNRHPIVARKCRTSQKLHVSASKSDPLATFIKETEPLPQETALARPTSSPPAARISAT